MSTSMRSTDDVHLSMDASEVGASGGGLIGEGIGKGANHKPTVSGMDTDMMAQPSGYKKPTQGGELRAAEDELADVVHFNRKSGAAFWLRTRVLPKLGPCLALTYSPESMALKDHYQFGPLLGQGSFGTVYAAKLRMQTKLYIAIFLQNSKQASGGAKKVGNKAGKGLTTDKNRQGLKSTLGQETNKHVARYLDGILTEIPATELDFKSRMENRTKLVEMTTTAISNAMTVADLDDPGARKGGSADAAKPVDWKTALEYPFACKVLFKYEVEGGVSEEEVHQEVKMLQRCQHPRVLLLVEYLEGGHCHYIITSRCYGCLEDRLRGVLVPSQHAVTCRKWTLQLLKGLMHVHAVGVLHQDVKPANMLCMTPLPDSCVVLGDFGLACTEADADPKDVKTGTRAFLAPELFAGIGPHSFATDVWAAGVTVHVMCSIQSPYRVFMRKKQKAQRERAERDRIELTDSVKEKDKQLWYEELGQLMRKGVRMFNPDAEGVQRANLSPLVKQALEIDPKKRSKCGQLLMKHFTADEGQTWYTSWD